MTDGATVAPVDVIDIIALIVALVALAYSVWSGKKQSDAMDKSSQVFMIGTILNGIQQCRIRISYEELSKDARETIKEDLLNQFEFYAFLVNNGIIVNPEMRKHIEDDLLNLLSEVKLPDDESKYEELRKLYHNITKTNSRL